ncbi:T9SS type A sorting domain-containing protein [Flavobacterium sp. ARAG 55.4]|uniref:T9SS type A sorting domain-containing protein n=1 Tax=Flavobacterium sp. ARAG 55.4 TaxID=3451357 RepID=UPI003F45FEA7
MTQNTVTDSNRRMESFSTTGSNITTSSGSVSYSVGQLFYAGIETADFNVAQGVQQAEVKETLSTKNESILPKTLMFVFPNPAKDFIYLTTVELALEKELISYKIFNLHGMLLKQSNISQEVSKIYLNDLMPSLYLLQVYQNNKLLKTFKIIKK